MRTRQISKNTNKFGKIILEYKFNIVFVICMFVLFLATPLLFVKEKRSKVTLATIVEEKCLRKIDSYDCNLLYEFYDEQDVLHYGKTRKESKLRYYQGDVIRVEYDPKNPENNEFDQLSVKKTATQIITGTLTILVLMYVLFEIIRKMPDGGTYYLASKF